MSRRSTGLEYRTEPEQEKPDHSLPEELCWEPEKCGEALTGILEQPLVDWDNPAERKAMREAIESRVNDPDWRPELREGETHTACSAEFHRLRTAAEDATLKLLENCLRNAPTEDVAAMRRRMGEFVGREDEFTEEEAAGLLEQCCEGEAAHTVEELYGERLRMTYGSAIMERADLNFIRENAGDRPLLEVGAGNGYLSHELRAMGTDITATEPYPVNRRELDLVRPELRETQWLETEPLDAAGAMEKYPGYNLVWAYPHPDGWPAVGDFRGDILIYIGEADPEWMKGFTELLERDLTLESRRTIPGHRGGESEIRVYLRKGTEVEAEEHHPRE